MAAYPSAGSEPRRKRKVAWPLVWLLLICLLLAGAGVTWWIVGTTQPNAAISQTLQAYCTALRQGNYQQAYNQWASGTLMSEADFAYVQKNRGQMTGCEISSVSIENSSANAKLSFSYVNGSTAVDQVSLVLENGVWKIKGQALN
jgi:hypothetical protein